MLFYIEFSLAARALDGVRLVVRGYFQCEAAGAAEEDEAVYPSHNIADLAELFSRSLFLLCLFGGLAECDAFFGESDGGERSFVFCDFCECVGVVFEGGAPGHVAQDFDSLRDRGVGAGEV